MLGKGCYYSLDWITRLTFLPVDWVLELSVVNAIIISSSIIVVTTCTLIHKY